MWVMAPLVELWDELLMRRQLSVIWPVGLQGSVCTDVVDEISLLTVFRSNVSIQLVNLRVPFEHRPI